MAKRAGSTIVEVKASHAIYVSEPAAVAALIEQAAKGVKTAGALANPAGSRDTNLVFPGRQVAGCGARVNHQDHASIRFHSQSESGATRRDRHT
jgi:hypothetical protein